MKILVIDAGSNTQSLLDNFFQSLGMPALIAPGMDAAVEILRKTNVDIVFLDLFSTGPHGLDALANIREISPRTETVVFTPYASFDAAIEAMKAGALDAVAKPINLEKLEITMRRVEDHVRMKKENETLGALMRRSRDAPEPVAAGEAFQKIMREVGLVAPTLRAVLIVGEAGTGKGTVARLVHRHSDRAEHPLVTLRPGDFKGRGLERELFGDKPGSSGKTFEPRLPLLEITDKGTLFIEEVDLMPRNAQKRLAEFIRTGEFEPTGLGRRISSSTRIIAAACANTGDALQVYAGSEASSARLPAQAIEAGRLGSKLYEIFQDAVIHVPPLREHPEDIPALVRGILARSRLPAARGKTVSSKAIEELRQYDWPGNVRELKYTIEYVLIHSAGDVIEPDDLPGGIHGKLQPAGSVLSPELPLAEVEKIHIKNVLRYNNNNKLRSARSLEISPKTLYNKLKEYNIPLRPRGS
jgi:DNA-binding NtrC family response regulator